MKQIFRQKNLVIVDHQTHLKAPHTMNSIESDTAKHPQNLNLLEWEGLYGLTSGLMCTTEIMQT